MEELYTTENSWYLQNNPTWHQEDSLWKANHILRILKNNPLDIDSVVEVGCGAGEILNQLYLALPNHIKFTGFDISTDAIKIAKQKENDRLEFRQEDFIDSEGGYDLMLLMDVFEHVEDYLGFLKKCKNRAKAFIFHIPLDISVQAILRNKLIHERKTVGHLHYFTKETAIATLTDSGYKIIDMFFTAATLDLPRTTLLSKLAICPRLILFKLNKNMASKILGGFSVLVLAKPME